MTPSAFPIAFGQYNSMKREVPKHTSRFDTVFADHIFLTAVLHHLLPGYCDLLSLVPAEILGWNVDSVVLCDERRHDDMWIDGGC